MTSNQFKISKKELKKLVKKMPNKRCILCNKKRYVLGIFHPYGPSDFAASNQDLRVPYFLCHGCALNAELSAQKVDEIMTLAYGKCKANA